MASDTSFLLAMGTRPEIIKMAPVYRALKESGAHTLLLHTGQHDDGAWPFYKFFGITPDFDVPLDRTIKEKPACDLAHLSSLLLAKIAPVIAQANPSTVLVHGDTSSALMTALAAFYQKRTIAHVEAGLRSHNMREPFPEEMNRSVIGRIADWHFAPTERAKKNLLAEGIASEKIYVVGNTIVDALHSISPEVQGNAFIDTLKTQLPDHQLALVTVHRRENHEHGIEYIAAAVTELIAKHPKLIVVWTVHPNPKVGEAVKRAFAKVSDDIRARLHLVPPLDYPILVWLMRNATMVLTDSGGIQEECVGLSTPVLILRNVTERPEVVESGVGQLVGTEKSAIIAAATPICEKKYGRIQLKDGINPFGDGTAAKKMSAILLKNVSKVL